MSKSSPESEKGRLLSYLKSLIEERIAESKAAIDSTMEARDSDSKSTAGDKHEVGRAMAQIELENQAAQLSKNEKLLDQLELIRLDRLNDEVGFGSLVKTDSGSYFISIGLGQVTIGDDFFFVISRESPFGQAVNGKKLGEEFFFNDRVYKVTGIS